MEERPALKADPGWVGGGGVGWGGLFPQSGQVTIYI